LENFFKSSREEESEFKEVATLASLLDGATNADALDARRRRADGMESFMVKCVKMLLRLLEMRIL